MCENPECPKVGKCKGECARKIFDWSKKARTELDRHRYEIVEDGEWTEDYNNDDVIALCDEYDNLF